MPGFDVRMNSHLQFAITISEVDANGEACPGNRARSEAFRRHPGGFKKFVFRMPDQVRHDGKLWTVEILKDIEE